MGNYLKKIKRLLDSGGTVGIVKEDLDPRDYNYSTAGLASTLTENDLRELYKQTMANTTAANTGPMPSMTASSGTSTWVESWDQWTEQEKESLAKAGFYYDSKKNEWVITLEASIRVPQIEGVMAGIDHDGTTKPTDIAVREMKKLKQLLIDKLTAKMILTELVRPREIKED